VGPADKFFVKGRGYERIVNTCRPACLSRDQNARQNHIVKKYNISFERMKQFSYLGTTLTNRNSIHEVIKSRMKSGNACYLSMQNLLSSSLLSKNIKIKVYGTIILPLVLYGCETWSLTLREEQRLRMFEKRMLRRIFGPKTDEVTGAWRRLHKEELNALYSSPNFIRVIKSRGMRWARHVVCTGRGEVYIGRPEGRRPLGRRRHRCQDNISMDLQEVGWEVMDWIDLAQDRDRWRAVENVVMKLRVP
jgi:hypothetical protein